MNIQWPSDILLYSIDFIGQQYTANINNISGSNRFFMSLLSLVFFLFAIACRPLAARTFEGGGLTSALYNLEKLLKQQHKE